MKLQYEVCCLLEVNLVEEAWLSSSGISTTENFSYVRKHIRTFDSKLEALLFIEGGEALKEANSHSFEIVEVYKLPE